MVFVIRGAQCRVLLGQEVAKSLVDSDDTRVKCR